MSHLLSDDLAHEAMKEKPLLGAQATAAAAASVPLHVNPSRFVPPGDSTGDSSTVLAGHAEWRAGFLKSGIAGARIVPKPVHLRLTKDVLSWSASGDKAEDPSTQPRRVYLANIVGADVGSMDKTDGSCELKVFVYRSAADDLKRGCCSSKDPADKQLGHKRERIELVFCFPGGGASAGDLLARQWASTISHLAQGLAVPSSTSEGGSWPLPPRRKLLVLVNPVSGQGKGVQLYRELCAPMLRDSNCEAVEVVTTHAGHATEYVAALPQAEAYSFDGIIAVGGDGALSEVVQGLMDRPDWRRITRRARIGALPGGSGNGLVVSFLKSAGLDYSFSNAALLIAKNASCPMDIASTFVMNDEASASSHSSSSASVHSVTGSGKDDDGGAVRITVAGSVASSTTTSGHTSSTAIASSHSSSSVSPAHHNHSEDRSLTLAGNWGPTRSLTVGGGEGGSGAGTTITVPHRRWQFLSTSWAIVSDIDIESEACRCLGAARFDAYGALRALCLRKYKGTLSFLPLSTNERSGQKWHAAAGISGTDSSSSSQASTVTPVDGSAEEATAASPSELVVSTISGVSEAIGASSSSAAVDVTLSSPGGTPAWPPIRHLVPFDHPVPLSWKSFESDTFTMVYITNTSHQSIGVCAAPGTKHHDGYFTITVVRNCTAFTMIPLLLGFDDHGSFAQGDMHFSEGGPVEVYKALAFRLEPEMNPKVSRRGECAP
jgi:Diacylglycerol kinase catalytic domain